MVFLSRGEFNAAQAYGVTLVLKLINDRFTLGYTDGIDFYDYTTNRRLSLNVIRKIGIVEEGKEMVKDEPKKVEETKPSGNRGLFDLDNDSQAGLRSPNREPFRKPDPPKPSYLDDVADDLPF